MPRDVRPVLTLHRLHAIHAALHSSVAGAAFHTPDGLGTGDFEGMDPKHFHAAIEWVDEQIRRRNAKKRRG